MSHDPKDHGHSHGKDCGHDHSHSHEGGCCGHSHETKKACCSHDHAHSHKHDHGGDCCGHDHKAEKSNCGHDHSHDGDCCGHDHKDGGDAEWTRKYFLSMQAVVLLLIGGLMCYFIVSGRIDGRDGTTPYVVGNFKLLVLGGGLGIVLMGVFNWLMRNRSAGCGHDHGDENCDGHEHEGGHTHHHDGSVAGRAITLLVLSGTIAAAAVMTPDQFTAKYLLSKGEAYRGDAKSAQKFKQENPELAAATAKGGFTLEKVEQYVKRTKDGNFPLSVVNLHYMSSDPEYARVMEGQPIETTGQVVKDTVNPGPGHLRVFTLQVTCCAADARPFSIPVVFENGVTPDHVEMGWYVVTGKLSFTQERGIKMAVINATNLKATLRPADQRPDF